MPLIKLIYHLNITYITLIRIKLQSPILAYNGSFQKKMHDILEVLKLKFTIPLLFWNLSYCTY